MNPMQTDQLRYTLTLDGHPPMTDVAVEFEPPEVMYVRSEHATKPNPLWRYTDDHGHEHRWADDALPTLTASSRHVECDGSCDGACEGEGYDVTVWHCTTCGDEVEPGWVPDWAARNVGVPMIIGPATATATVTGRPLEFTREQLTGVLSAQGKDLRVQASLHDVRTTMSTPWVSVLFLVLNTTP